MKPSMTMMNSIHTSSQMEPAKNSAKVLNSRRPLQPRSINSSSSAASPAKKLQTSKPKHSVIIKPRMDPRSKLSVLSENDAEWPCLSKQKTPSIESSESDVSRPVFRRRADIDEEDDDDMFVLKRANPVYDSDDEDEIFSPSKRQRTGEPTVLSWCDRVDEDAVDGFSFSETSLLTH